MKPKSILCMALAMLLVLSCLTGCRNANTPESDAAPEPERQEEAQNPHSTKETEQRPGTPDSAVLLSAVTNARDLGFSELDSRLLEYLKQTGRAEENFTVSPLSFKAALTMAALGAEGETQAQLLEALGFRSAEELRAWYASVEKGVNNFDAFFADLERYRDDLPELYGDAKRTSAYRVVNSVWSNQDLPGAFRKSFLDDIAKTCGAEADSAHAAELADAVNDWVNQKTEGLIPSILNDASEVSAILVNALYLKSGWEEGFAKLGTQDFTTCSGETTPKPFMHQVSRMRYYKDEQTQLVSVPLQGGVSMVFVLGDDTGTAEKLSRAENKLVDVTLPMFDVETTLDQKELVNYLRLLGCDRMFTNSAEFDPMYSEPLYVDDIIQKAKVHIDEEGLEAAAVTAIIMKVAGALIEPEEPEVFCADRPFSFYVLKDGASPELLFWGQIVK